MLYWWWVKIGVLLSSWIKQYDIVYYNIPLHLKSKLSLIWWITEKGRKYQIYKINIPLANNNWHNPDICWINSLYICIIVPIYYARGFFVIGTLQQFLIGLLFSYHWIELNFKTKMTESNRRSR